jgi:pyruvate formate lyase activating enzyme
MVPVLENTQLVYLDLKHMNPTEHVKLVGTGNELILENAAKILQLAGEGQLDVIVRCTCVPGYNDSGANLAETARFLAESEVKRVELLRYHELGVPKYAVLKRQYQLQELRSNDEHLKDLQAVIRSYGLACRVL